MISEDHDKNTQVIALSRLSQKNAFCRPLLPAVRLRKLTIDKSDFNDNRRN